MKYVIKQMFFISGGWRLSWYDPEEIQNLEHHLLPGLIKHLQRELSMKYTHLLELSTTEPRQYRITVLDDTREATMQHMVSANTEGFNVVGWYDTPAELMEVLVPYLHMENSR